MTCDGLLELRYYATAGFQGAGLRRLVHAVLHCSFRFVTCSPSGHSLILALPLEGSMVLSEDPDKT